MGAAGFPVADLGDTVQQSLRFNRNQWLASPAVTLSTYTASIWLKLGRIRNPSVSGGVTQIIIGTAGTGGHGVGFSNNKLYSTHTGDESTQEFRDPSGWYHLVINSTGNLYINGVEIATGGGLHDPNSEEIVLGHIWPQNSQNSTYAFEGLLANYHFIDGQELTPTSFGRTNEDGVWVPKNYTGTYGTNGARLIFDSSAGIGNDTSGNNNDYSIGGTFDTGDVALYSAYVFSSAASPIDFSTTSIAGFSTTDAGGYGRKQMFDNGASNGQPNSQSFVAVFRPKDPITVSTGIRIRPNSSTAGAQFPVFINGSSTATTTLTGAGSPSFQNVSFTGTLNSIVVAASTNTGDNSGWQAIEIDGTVLVDNTDNDVDFLDTPTSNYATYNPVAFANSSGGTYSAANLGNAAGSNWDIAAPTVKLGTTEKWYAEFDFKTNYHASTMFGMVDVTVDPTDGYANKLNPGFGVGMAGDSGYKDGSLYNSGSQFAPDFRTTGGYMMWAYDAATRNVWIGKDGTWYGSGDPASGANPTITLTAGSEYMLSISSYSSSVGFANFGQMPFLFTQPTEFKALQTNNLPEPTIKNGKEHFQAIIANANQGVGSGERGGNWGAFLTAGGQDIWTGAVKSTVGGFDGNTTSTSTSVSSVGPLVFEPDEEITFSTSLRVSVNHGTGGNGHIEFNGTTTTCGNPFVMTTVASSGTIGPGNPLKIFGQSGVANANLVAIEVDGDVLVDSGPLAAAQTTFPNGLWWIKDRDNSNQHQFVDSVRGSNLALTCPTVGGDQAYSAPSGDSVAWCWNYDSSDPSINGFEIITYTGNATVGRTVSHNLGKAPDFIITKERDNNGNLWCFYHSAGGVGYGYLNLTIPYQHSASSPVMWTATSSTNWTYDANGQVNGLNTDYVSYAWTSVPGFSAFGSFQGNSNNDGPFIYLGFKPQMLMIRTSGAGDSFFMVDSTRSPNNPIGADGLLNAGTTDSEGTWSARDIDFLSNGFKLRSSSGSVNGGTVLYAAWAENPFGGENAPPATAR